MKEQKGITLLTLTVTIIVLIILTFTIGINAPDLLHMRRKTNFENDMISLKEEIDQYYARYDALPIINKYTNISMLNDIKNANDNENYYVIDLSKISVNLNYGKGYETVKAKDISEEISDISDVYIINERSHTIYYPKGIEYNDKTNYTLDTYTKINTYIKANLDIEKVDTKSVKLIAKGINVGDDKIIASYEFYVDDILQKTVETTNETASYSFDTTFGDYVACVKIKDTEGNIYKSNEVNIQDYTIKTPEELSIFRDNVNNGTTYEGKTITLLNDIDLSEVCGKTIGTWTPIAYSEDVSFSGIFEGNNNTIENLYIDEDNIFTALFGRIEKGTIQNLNITGSVKGRRATAGFVGFSNEGNVINCKNYCIVDTAEYGSKYSIDGEDSNNRKYGYVAGIVGNNHGIIEKCVNYGQITGLTCVGGIAGVNIGEKANVKECFNTAQIKSVETEYSVVGTGGIVGNNQAKVTDVYNKGEVTTEAAETGGIIGWQGFDNAIVKNIYNIADITTGAKGSNGTGGCIGVSNNGNVVIENAYMTGKVKNKNTGVYATSLVGNYNTTGAYNIGFILGTGKTNTEQDLSGYYLNTTQEVMSGWTEEEIKKYLGENFTKDINNINEGYPILKWQLEI